MLRSRILKLGVLAVAALGLSACADNYGRAPYGGVGYGAAPYHGGGYDAYYGNSLGWQSVPYGYVGSNFGWSGGYYYPGTGYYVYDRRGQRRAWSNNQQRYWAQRGAISNRVGGAIAGQQRPVIRQQQRVIRNQQQVIREQRRDVRQAERRDDRRGDRARGENRGRDGGGRRDGGRRGPG